MAAPVVQPPSAEDIAIPTPPPREQGDEDQLFRFLSQTAKAGQFNATLQRQERATLLSIFGVTIDATVIAGNGTAIANPPTQANVQSLQATINLLVLRVNILSIVLAAFLDAANANLKSLPATD